MTMRKGDETVKKQTRDQTPLAIRPRPRWSPGPPPCGEDRGLQRCPSCWTLAGAGLHGGGESASGPVSSLPGPSGSGPRSSLIVSERMNGERGPVPLENEVRAELGRVLVYGRFLSGRQTPPGPAEGREDREAGVLRQMSRQPRGPFSGPSAPRLCLSPAALPSPDLQVSWWPGRTAWPRTSYSPLALLFSTHSSSGDLFVFFCSQPCCPTVPGARLALGKYWLSK